jgi:cell wall-associated NlpC family hydrolase
MAVRRVCVISVLGLLVLAGLAGVASAQPLRETAYKQALAGASASQILRSAFPTGVVTKIGGHTVRVLVADLAPTVIIEGQTAMTVADQAPGGTSEAIPAHQRVQITPALAGGIVTGLTVTNIDAVPQQTVTMTGPIRLSTGTSMRIDKPVGMRFRGALRVVVGFDNKLDVINDVSAEAYDYGVLAGQVPANWGPKAQQAAVAVAIAVRSRAVASLRPASAAWDVTADMPYLYLGIDGERTATTAAVVKSAGKVLTQGGKVMNVGFIGIQPILFAPSPGKPDFVANGPARAIPGARAGKAAAALALARAMLHHRYVYGGANPSGFDCSGLMYWIFHTNFGFSIPRDANSQSKVGIPVQRNDLQPGDLVFFADSSGYVTHVGMYIGNEQFINAANPGAGVKIDSLTENYFAHTYAGARRFSPLH